MAFLTASEFRKKLRRGLKASDFHPSVYRPTTPKEELEHYGYELPKKGWSLLGKRFLNVLSGVLEVLRTGEYAVGGILAGKSPITGIREKISPSEALGIKTEETRLWSKEGLTALAVDILLDPTTYITFGTGGAMKIATRGGMIPLTKAGQDLMRKMIERGASEATARRVMAKLIQRGGKDCLLYTSPSPRDRG